MLFVDTADPIWCFSFHVWSSILPKSSKSFSLSVILTGAPIQASDLRAGAALVIAALAAKGRSEITQVHYIERGYEDIVSKLQALGADIQSVEEPDINLEANVG